MFTKQMQLFISIALEVFDPQRIQPFLQSNQAAGLLGGMVAVVIYHNLTVNSQSTSVIRNKNQTIESVLFNFEKPIKGYGEIVLASLINLFEIESVDDPCPLRSQFGKIGQEIVFTWVEREP